MSELKDPLPIASSRVTTACTLDCPDGCSLILARDAAGNVRVEGNPAHPITEGFTCRKIKSFLRRLRSPNRILHPLLRSGADWKQISWNEALDLCAEKVQALRSQPASILHFHGEGAKGALKQASKAFFARLGSCETKGSLCDAAGYVAYLKDFGSRVQNDIRDIGNARAIVSWGKDLSRSSVHTAVLVQRARRNGARVLTVSPGGDGSEAFSDDRIRIRPGTDRFLAAAVIRLMMERGLPREETRAHVQGWQKMRALLDSHPLSELLAACTVSAGDAERLLACYTQQRPTATLIGAGLQRYGSGGENTRWINALAVLSGNMGVSGGGSYFHLHSLKDFNLDWTKPEGGKTRRALLMPTIAREILNATGPPIRMIWVDASNLVNQVPNIHETIRAFESIPFKVVVDAFMTDTAARANLILPCALMWEQEDVVGSYLHHYVNHARAVFDPPGEAKTDFWILTELGKRLDPPVLLPEIEAILRASIESPWLSGSLETLRERGFLPTHHARVVYEGMCFDHPNGKCHLVTTLTPETPPPREYPLRLLTLIRGDAIHSQILPEDQDMVPSVWISSEHPLASSIEPGTPATLVSPHGSMTVRLHVALRLHPEAVVYRRGDWFRCGGGANRLIDSLLTDMGRGAAYYHQYVRLEIAPESERRDE
ncbi:MAG: molybdopterin-dependent oxidoreductase [Syntrophobacteraceae bacterium]